MTLRIGLTGSIGMGKSTVAQQCALLGFPIFNADKIAHDLLHTQSVIALISQKFSDVMVHGVVDRARLGDKIFNSIADKIWLEQLLHPMIREQEEIFFQSGKAKACGALICDIPLLYETGADARMFAVMVVNAPEFMQRQRVLKRRNMSEEKYENILDSQWPQSDKCRLADRVISTSLGKRESLNQVKEFLTDVGLCVK